MKVKFKNGKKASEKSLQKLEGDLGFQLSKPFRAFVQCHDGARPEPDSFSINKKNGDTVVNFIPVSKINRERQWIENLPPRAYPVAGTSCGNYVFVDEGKNGKVYFWDHELAKITKIADNFDHFLSILRPTAVDSTGSDEGEIIIGDKARFRAFIEEQRRLGNVLPGRWTEEEMKSHGL